jgi:hypothetical protein
VQVEVNEENIDRFGLVELTNNSKEDLLRFAQQAKDNGHILTVALPEEMTVNMFDVGMGGRRVPEQEIRAQDQAPNPIMSESKFRARTDQGIKVEITVKGVTELDDDEEDVVDGEIVEED